MSNYEVLRNELLEDIKKQEGQDVLDLKAFDKKFNKLFEMANFDLLNDPNDKFYGIFLSNCNRVKCYVIESPFSHQMFNSKINLLINPLQIVKLTIDEVKLYMKHEVIHLISEHYKATEELKNKYPQMIPLLAADLITNDILERDAGQGKLHKNMLTVAKFNETFKEELTIYNENHQKMGMAELCETISRLCKTNELLNKFVNDYNSFVIDKAQQELEDEIKRYKQDMEEELSAPANGAAGADDEGSGQMDLETLAKMMMSSIMKVKGDLAFIGDMLKNVVIETMGQSRGKYPGGLMSLIEKIMAPPVITWQQVLAKLLNSIPAGKKPTVFRRNRLHPERLDLKGKLPDKELDIVFAIDTSGSVSNKEISEIANEIFAITKLMKTKITIVECDTSIGKVYEANCPDEVQLDVSGRGGTSFTPVFEWLKENKNKETILIYASDGYGEQKLAEDNITQSTIWLMTREKMCLSCKGDVRPQDKILSLTNK